MSVLKSFVTGGSVLLILLGCLHAVHVALADDVEPYLWAVSAFLIVHGVLTLVYLRRRGKRRRSYLPE